MINGSPGREGQRLLTGLVKGQCPLELKRQARQNKHLSAFEKKKGKSNGISKT